MPPVVIGESLLVLAYRAYLMRKTVLIPFLNIVLVGVVRKHVLLFSGRLLLRPPRYYIMMLVFSC